MLQTSIEKFTPLVQALFCLVLALAGMLGCHFLFPNRGFEFSSAFVAIILYSIVNPFVSVFHAQFKRYTWPSWGLFALLLLVLLLSARFISGSSIQQYSQYLYMLKSIVPFYIVTSLLVRLVRLMWEFAEDDDN